MLLWLVNKIININKENNKYEEINSNGSTCVFGND